MCVCVCVLCSLGSRRCPGHLTMLEVGNTAPTLATGSLLGQPDPYSQTRVLEASRPGQAEGVSGHVCGHYCQL